MTTIDTADHVLHRPTGETWLVAYVQGDRLCACGWPETLAALSDCDLVKKATPAERLQLLRDLAVSTAAFDTRVSHARWVLAQAESDGGEAD